MATQVGIAKQVVGSVVAVDANGKQRVLQAGDAVYLGEVVKVLGGGKATLSMDNAKSINISENDAILVDQSVTQTQSFKDDALANLSDLQKAILAGENLTQLEETAAGGGAGGAAGGTGTAMLNESYFVSGGHETNVSADGRNLPDNAFSFANPFNAIGTGTDANVDTPVQPTPNNQNTTPPSPSPLPQPIVQITQLYSEDVWDKANGVMDETNLVVEIQDLQPNGSVKFYADGVEITPSEILTQTLADGTTQISAKFDPQVKGANIKVVATQSDGVSGETAEILEKEYINIEVPTSAYTTQDLSGSVSQLYSDMMASKADHTQHTKTKSGVDRLYDRMDASEFSYNKGWWLSSDGKTVIGSDGSATTELLISDSVQTGLRDLTAKEQEFYSKYERTSANKNFIIQNSQDLMDKRYLFEESAKTLTSVFMVSRAQGDASEFNVFGSDNVDHITTQNVDFGGGKIYTGSSQNAVAETTPNYVYDYATGKVYSQDGDTLRILNTKLAGIETGSGSDDIRISDRSVITGDINTHDGGDFINFNSGSALTGNVNLGDGTNIFKANAGDGEGRNSMAYGEVRITGNIVGGSGNDRVDMGHDSLAGVKFNGDITLNDGDDLIALNGRQAYAHMVNSTLEVNANIDMGAGNDAVWQDTDGTLGGSVKLGDGDDTFASWQRANRVAGTSIDAGLGEDIIDVRNYPNIDFSNMHNFEAYSLGQYNNHMMVTHRTAGLTANNVKDLLTDDSDTLTQEFFDKNIFKLKMDLGSYSDNVSRSLNLGDVGNDKLSNMREWRETTNATAIDSADTGNRVYESRTSDGFTVFIQIEDQSLPQP